MILSFLVISCFFMYAALEAVSLLPRVAGSMLGSNGLGYTFSVMVSTLKRVFIVSYPPLLGWLTSKGESLYLVIFLSYFFGVIALFFAFYFRRSLIKLFLIIISEYSKGRSFFSIIIDRNYENKVVGIVDDFEGGIFRLNLMLVISSAWIYFIYGSSLFFINLFGSMHQDKSAVIYQLVGLINSLGTLLMSFFLDPRISKNFDRQEKVICTYNSVIFGQFLALGIIGPFSVSLFYLFFS